MCYVCVCFGTKGKREREERGVHMFIICHCLQYNIPMSVSVRDY